MKVERIKQEYDDREMSHDPSLLQGNKSRGRKDSFHSVGNTLLSGKASAYSKNLRLSQIKSSQKRTSNSVNDNCSMQSCGLSSSNKWSTSSKSKKIKKGDKTKKVKSNLANKKVSQFKKVSFQSFYHFFNIFDIFGGFGGFLRFLDICGWNQILALIIDKMISQLIKIFYFIKMEHPL